MILSSHAPDIVTSCEPTDIVVLRRGADGRRDKQAFVDALSIVARGTRIGARPVRLLATREWELGTRLALPPDGTA